MHETPVMGQNNPKVQEEEVPVRQSMESADPAGQHNIVENEAA